MKKIAKTLLVVLLVLVTATSCGKDDPDGLWAIMEWEKPAGIVEMDGVYLVPALGGTYKFTCKNYKPWIGNILEAGVDFEQMVTFYDHRYCEGSWFSVKCEGNFVIFTFKLRPADDYNHALLVTLTAGDIFDNFTFIQNPRIQDE